MVSTEYVNNSTPLKYLCPIHGGQSISYNNLKSGHGCMICGHESTTAKQKCSYEYVRDKFKESHLTLLDKTYIDGKKLMKYQCDICNRVGEITYNSLRVGTKCLACAKESRSAKQRHSYDFIKGEFAKSNLCLLSNSYKSNGEYLKYKCNICGNIGYIQYRHLQQGEGCSRCKSSKGEKTIAKWLFTNNIIYSTQYTFKNLLSSKDRKLRFDFAVFKDDGKTLWALIEFNGIQHYIPKDFGGKGEAFAQQQFIEGQERDQLKIDYCKFHDIPLLVIKYDQDIKQVLQDNLL